MLTLVQMVFVEAWSMPRSKFRVFLIGNMSSMLHVARTNDFQTIRCQITVIIYIITLENIFGVYLFITHIVQTELFVT